MNEPDLQALWTEQGRKLEASVRLNQALLHAVRVDRARPPLRRLTLALVLELAAHGVSVVLLTGFMWLHLLHPRLLVPAAALDLGVFALAAATLRQLRALQRIDLAGPVLESQRGLAALRIERLRTTRAVLVMAPLAWTPLLIVGMKGLLGVDVWGDFPAWLVANFAFGVVALPLGWWGARWLAGRSSGSAVLRRLARDLAGVNLAAATEALSSLEAYEQPVP